MHLTTHHSFQLLTRSSIYRFSCTLARSPASPAHALSTSSVFIHSWAHMEHLQGQVFCRAWV
jgi:hypothetical protein